MANNETNSSVLAICTVGIGSDRYAGAVVKATKSLKTLEVEFATGSTTFRWSPSKGRYVSGCYRLTLGVAETYRDPCF